jgi:hypothetical protein
MNDAWGYDANDGQDETQMNGPKALRDAYKALKAQNDELNQKLTSFLESQQKSQMATVFSTLGVPGAVDLYQGEPDPEKARAWVDSMRGVFGNGAVQGDTPAPVQPAVTDDQQAALQRMTEAGQHGTPMGNVEAAQSGVNSATDMQSLIAAFANGMNRQ